MSWLFVGFVPGLLMLATFGLDRLEAGLGDDSGPDPEPVWATPRRPAAPAPPPPSNGAPRNGAVWPVDLDRPYLPTRVYVHHQPKTAFQATRQPDRV